MSEDIGTSSLIYYRLYMDDGYTEISKNTASGTTITEFFEFLTPGNPYRFAVAAVNAAGEGPRSERITLTASDVAGQPYDVEATFQSSYRIDLQWKKPLLTGASGMSGYKVWVDDGNGGGINNLIWDGGTKAATLLYSWAPVFSDGTVALLAGHTYRFQVQSVNPTGDGARSNVFSIVAASKPDAPGRPGVDRQRARERAEGARVLVAFGSLSALLVVMSCPCQGRHLRDGRSHFLGGSLQWRLTHPGLHR